jgi:flavin-dependent thymidylate synthase
MKVRIAGFSVDYDALKSGTGYKRLTPETLSAAYARISRSPRPIHELRYQSRQEVEKARRSNKKIIFGMGHHSVAEHAVFNFDITGISRRAVEELEHHRLCSYTEKSQRYVTLQGDYVVPRELEDSPYKDAFIRIITEQNACYVRMCKKIKEKQYTDHPKTARTKHGRKLLENLAKEDARYILSLATQAQLGMTVNARNLELMIRRFASHPMNEMQELGMNLYELAARISPSLFLFCSANTYDQDTYPSIARFANTIKMQKDNRKDHRVKMISHSRNTDIQVLTSLLFHTTDRSFAQCKRTVMRMSKEKKKQLFKEACKHAELYDTMLREFEMAHFTFQLIVSAGCFGQLKRHRMATLICQDYDTRLGVTIPDTVVQVGEKKPFQTIINKTEKLHDKIVQEHPQISSYILTNAHRRRVLMRMDLRELYHLSRLREDPAAQWDIRQLSTHMTTLARTVTPICGQLLGGKEMYPRLYQKIFGRFPKVKHTPEV